MTCSREDYFSCNEQDQHCLIYSQYKDYFSTAVLEMRLHSIEQTKTTLKSHGKQVSTLITHLKFRRNKALNKQGLKLQFFTQLSDAVQQPFCLTLMLLLLVCHLK